jgi:hypothetical protein
MAHAALAEVRAPRLTVRYWFFNSLLKSRINGLLPKARFQSEQMPSELVDDGLHTGCRPMQYARASGSLE